MNKATAQACIAAVFSACAAFMFYTEHTGAAIFFSVCIVLTLLG